MPTSHPTAGRIIVLLCLLFGAPFPAAATVRFGGNVFIGGHDFSHQSFDRKHRAVIHLYDRAPRHAGCAWHADRHGGRVKVCHLGRIRRR